MRIRNKIFLGYSIVFIILVLSGILNFYTRYILIKDSQEIKTISEYIDNTDHLSLNVLQLLMPANDFLITCREKEVENYNTLYQEAITQLKKVESASNEMVLIETIKKNIERINDYTMKIFSLGKNGANRETTSALMYQMDRVGDQTRNFIDEHHEAYQKKLNMLQSKSEAHARIVNYFMLGTWMVLITLGILFLFIFNKDVRIPIEKLSQGFRGVSHGRWSHVNLPQKDELGQLASEFNSMVERLGSSYEDLESEVRSRNRELHELNKKLEAMAVTDGLTGLFNHRHFHEKLQEEFERAKRYGHPMAVLMMDIDFFKQYNDTYGHQAGDLVIKGVADILKKESRKTDIVARYGGEEFVILSPEMDSLHAVQFAERIRNQVEQSIKKDQKLEFEKKVTLSIGISIYPDIDTSAEELLKGADESLYSAKRKGRNQVVLSGTSLK